MSKMTEKGEAGSNKETKIWTDEGNGEVRVKGLEQRGGGWGEMRNLEVGTRRWLLSLMCFPCKHVVQRSDPWKGVNAGGGHGGLPVFSAPEGAPQSKQSQP